VGDTTGAEAAHAELEVIAAEYESEFLDAIVAHARGGILMANGDHPAAVAALRKAFDIWNRFGAPYLAARIRVDIGITYRELGDSDGAAFELETAQSVFVRLGAKPDLDRIASLTETGARRAPGGLTKRELEILRLIAAGMPNRAIAAELAISERTVHRHVSNILVKLDLHSRAAATAFAYKHGLV
jgi:DNA-binding NarL/FixJ family response regulator